MITAEICQGRVNLLLNWLSNLCSENCIIQRIVTVLRFDWRKYSNAFYAMQPERTQQNEWISHAQVRYHRANQPTLWSRPDSVELCSDLDSSFCSVYFSTLSPFTYCKDYIVSLISFSCPQTHKVDKRPCQQQSYQVLNAYTLEISEASCHRNLIV